MLSEACCFTVVCEQMLEDVFIIIFTKQACGEEFEKKSHSVDNINDVNHSLDNTT